MWCCYVKILQNTLSIKTINQNISFIKLLTKYFCEPTLFPSYPFSFSLPFTPLIITHKYILSMHLRRMLHSWSWRLNSVISMRSFGLCCQQPSILNSKQPFVLAKREKHDIWLRGECVVEMIVRKKEKSVTHKNILII